MPPQANNVRRAAISSLRAWAKGYSYIDSLIEKQAAKNSLSKQDRALLKSLVSCVLRNRRLLDFWIAKLRKGKLDHETRDILRVGLAQLLLLGIADHAAVNETVNCGKASTRGLINAVLRQAIERRPRLVGQGQDLPIPEKLSHPDWLWKRWRSAFGKPNAERLLKWNNQPAKTYARINSLKGEAPEVAQHENTKALEGIDGFYELLSPPPHDWIKNGLIYIQDPATRHSVELLNPKPGESVLDACAAPGGKSVMIAAAMQNDGAILCTDSNEKRLPRLHENLENLGVNIAQVEIHDWMQPAPKDWHGKFDAILLDVPCSNTGVIRRRIDARWRITPESIIEIQAIQKAILTHALPCIKEGGRIVYSTCSIENEENSDFITQFLADHSEWALDGEHKALPHINKTDGAYAARLVKKA